MLGAVVAEIVRSSAEHDAVGSEQPGGPITSSGAAQRAEP